MAQKAATLKERQEQLNEHFGKGEYKLLSYTSLYTPASLKHKCGNIIEKQYQYFNNYIKNGHNICPCTFKKTGPKAKSIKQRQSELDKLFDNSYKITAYEHTNKPLTVMHSCGQETTTLFQSLVSGDTSCRCLHKHDLYLTLDKHQLEITKRYGPDFKVLDFNQGSQASNVYLHTQCGYIWEATRHSVMHGSKHCPQCAGKFGSNLRRNTIEQVEAKINKYSKHKFRVLNYVDTKTYIIAQCVKCNTTNSTIHPMALQYGVKCLGCGDTLALRKVIIDKKRFILRGYEPQALNILINEGLKARDIFYKRSNVPRFDYIFRKKRHRYQPDFYIKSTNTIVEVKSDYTLGLTNDRKIHGSKSFMRNKAKAKAVIKKGYTFRLIVINANGLEVQLPLDWFNYTRKALMTTLKNVD